MTEKTIHDWHSLLHDRFDSLRQFRERQAPSSSVFALEHGLDLEDELPKLESAVRGYVGSGSRLSLLSWLPFVVYAAEIGYQYEGDEYWPVFEDKTPGWKRHGQEGHKYIRKRYSQFTSTYGGAKPSGPWAEHFTIISWPITHAVLPKDLQRHLARLVSDYRNAFTASLLKDHEALGKQLASRSENTSARFSKFAENTSLLGLVASSLLLDDEVKTPLLSQDVLKRIRDDISRERQAGEWLKDAKRAAVRVYRKGLLPPPPPIKYEKRHERQQWPKLEIGLELRQSNNEWLAYITLPSFKSIAHRFPSNQDRLERLRCRIDGVPGIRARGSMMYQQGPLPLKTMPQPRQTPLSLEGEPDSLYSLLVDHCRMPSPPWLFRIDEPGLAKEVRTKQVRPGKDYIVLSNEKLVTNELYNSKPIQITTEGVYGIQFSIPNEVDEVLINKLRDIDLGIIYEFIVWPAGIVPASWDNEGRAAYLAGEEPIIGIQSSRRVTKCKIRMAEDTEEILWPDDNDTIFVQMKELQIGIHDIEISLFSADESMVMMKGSIEVQVLEPVDSVATANIGQAVQTWVYPPNPTLDELWNGFAVVTVEGPHNERAQFKIELIEQGSRKKLASKSFSSKLPVRKDRWRELFSTAKGEWNKNTKDLNNKVGRAEELHIITSNPTLGISKIRVERPFQPLRWVPGYDRNNMPFAQLIDHMDNEDLTVSYRKVTEPAKSIQIKLPEDQKIKSPNGRLVIAQAADFKTAIILPPHIHISNDLKSLKKLSYPSSYPSLPFTDRSAVSINNMIELAHLWTKLGFPADNFAASLQSQVNNKIIADLSGIIAGKRWYDIELKIFKQNRALPEELLSAVGDSKAERITAAKIMEFEPCVGVSPYKRTEIFTDHLRDYGWQIEAKRAILILQLGTDPGSIDQTKPSASDMISDVLRRPMLVRLARLFILMTSSDSFERGTSLLKEWAWD